jgi:hypothetical protein
VVPELWEKPVKISSVIVTFTHEDDTDPVNAVDEILTYAMNRGLYAEELGLSASKLALSVQIPTIDVHDGGAYGAEYVIPDWEVVSV